MPSDSSKPVPKTTQSNYEDLEGMAESEVDCNGTDKIEDTKYCIKCMMVYPQDSEECMSCGAELDDFSDLEIAKH